MCFNKTTQLVKMHPNTVPCSVDNVTIHLSKRNVNECVIIVEIVSIVVIPRINQSESGRKKILANHFPAFYDL